MSGVVRGELKGTIVRFLNKTAQFRGFYTDDKINDAIQEALDFIATEMFLAGQGWQTKILHRTTVAGQVSVPIPSSVAMIDEVRCQGDGNIYYPMRYFTESNKSQVVATSGEQQRGERYRIIDNMLYFNPPLDSGGENYLQIEYQAYPKVLVDDNDQVEGHFDRAMQHYLKYKSCSILAASLEKPFRPWATEEGEWYAKMLAVVSKRNKQPVVIQPFGTY